jgi:hypothetical protein
VTPRPVFLWAQDAGEESLITLKTQFFDVLFNATAAFMLRRKHPNLTRRFNAVEDV